LIFTEKEMRSQKRKNFRMMRDTVSKHSGGVDITFLAPFSYDGYRGPRRWERVMAETFQSTAEMEKLF
jgi:hypothetical protein